MLRPVRHFAVAAIGRDRPGIVAAVTHNLLDHELNVEDSQMTILGGHFTTMMIVSGGDGVDLGALRADLGATGRELNLEAVSVEEVADAARATSVPTHIVTVYGVDHPGLRSPNSRSTSPTSTRGWSSTRRARPAPTATAARTCTR
jgi:glycine cleavage system transcriptional repressor